MPIICYFWSKVERKLVANRLNSLASIQIDRNCVSHGTQRKRNSIQEMVRQLRGLSFQPSLAENNHSMVEIRIDIPPVFHQKQSNFKPLFQY